MFFRMNGAKAAAILAAFNLAVPQAMTLANEPVAARPAKAASDIVLSASGELTGRVVTADGAPVDGAKVTLTQNGKTVATTVSTDKGEFRVASLKSGLYRVSAGTRVQLVRAWSQDAAPPMARPSATIVQGNVVRGQDEWDYFETDEMVVAGIATAALIVGTIALVEVEDDNEDNAASP